MILNFELLKSILPLNCIFKGNKIIIFSGIQSVYECSENEITWVKPGVKSAKELINSTVRVTVMMSFLDTVRIPTTAIFLILWLLFIINILLN